MKIKNLSISILTLLFFSMLTFNSCKKDFDALADLPETFTKKVLIEEFTGEWCGACASAFPRIQTILDENPTTVFAAALHYSDPFSTTKTHQIKSTFGISSFPSALVDRYSFGTSSPRVPLLTSTLRNKSETRLEEKITTGLRIDTEFGEEGKATIKVFVGQNKIMDGEPRITTYLIEDEVPEVNQSDASGDDYRHHAVVRKILTEAGGNKLNNLEVQERDFITLRFENIDISEFDKNHLSVLAFVHYSDASDKSNHEIINVQKVKLGKNQDWD
ncbi:MAG: thiol-disulfide isomerase/thioredoxin [Granulosicoccus sp.]|jgi:thiol-disulfide isomerase/thioredoxin